jgi:beta-glucosidase
VVQLYVGDPDAEVHRPVRELRGFEKVRLQPGASVRVSFELESRDFAYWDAAAVRPDGRAGLWRREGGEFRIEVGASSQDIRLAASIDLNDDPTIPPLVPDAELIDIAASRFVQGHAG